MEVSTVFPERLPIGPRTRRETGMPVDVPVTEHTATSALYASEVCFREYELQVAQKNKNSMTEHEKRAVNEIGQKAVSLMFLARDLQAKL